MEAENVSAEENGAVDVEDIDLSSNGCFRKHHGVLKIGKDTRAVSLSLTVVKNNGTTNVKVKEIGYGVQSLDWSNFIKTVLAYSKVGVVIDISQTTGMFRKVWLESFPHLPNVKGLNGQVAQTTEVLSSA